MGVVYTPEQIRQGKIPEDGAHKQAGQFVLERFEKLHYNITFRGGMVYGSTTQEPTRRSDFDVLTVHDPNFIVPGSLDLLAEIYREVEEAFHVRVECNTLLLACKPASDDHQLDPLYAVSLKRSAEAFPEWRVGDPLKHLTTDEITKESAVAAAKQYAALKERRFLESLVDPSAPPIDYRRFQRALELPSALGRKAISALGYGQAQDVPLRNRSWFADRAEAILGQYSHGPDGLSSHRKLSALDNEYTELLECTISGETPLSRYERWLTYNYRYALYDARALASAWKSTLDNEIPADCTIPTQGDSLNSPPADDQLVNKDDKGNH